MEDLTVLSDTILMEKVPTAFFQFPSVFMSDKYTLIKTTDVIRQLKHYGWEPVEAKQTSKYERTKRDARYHLIRFRKPHMSQHYYAGDSVPEIVMFNSNNGSCPFRLEAGIFRLVCSNGLIWKEQDMGSLKKKHIGNFDIHEYTPIAIETL